MEPRRNQGNERVATTGLGKSRQPAPLPLNPRQERRMPLYCGDVRRITKATAASERKISADMAPALCDCTGVS